MNVRTTTNFYAYLITESHFVSPYRCIMFRHTLQPMTGVLTGVPALASECKWDSLILASFCAAWRAFARARQPELLSFILVLTPGMAHDRQFVFFMVATTGRHPYLTIFFLAGQLHQTCAIVGLCRG